MRVLVSALEPSSNIHLKEILNNIDRDLELVGVFDSNISTYKPLYDMQEFSVMGVSAVLSKIFKSFEAIRELASISKNCDKVLLIDAPAFNIPLAKAIKKRNPNIEIIYYILPKVWAWKKNRVKKIERYCDRLISIFPFEQQFYKEEIEYFGNPLLDEIKNFKRSLNESGKVAFLAGSRASEIKALMPIFRELAKKIHKEAILVIPKHFDSFEIYGDIEDFKIYRESAKALFESEFAFVCSGTATLEAALIGTPSILLYRARAIDYFIGRLFVKLNYVGLANIIFEFENLEPMQLEFLQGDVNIPNLLRAYTTLDRERFLKNSQKLRELLKGGSSKEVARILERR